MRYGLHLPRDLTPTTFTDSEDNTITHTEFPLLFVTAFQSTSTGKDPPSLRNAGM